MPSDCPIPEPGQDRALGSGPEARLGGQPAATEATHGEVMQFIERHKIMGRGIGYIDIHLLAAAALNSGTRLWTRDKRLAGMAENMDLGFMEPS